MLKHIVPVWHIWSVATHLYVHNSHMVNNYKNVGSPDYIILKKHFTAIVLI
jgi:hypothetical protein